jgi:hypothetical protein
MANKKKKKKPSAPQQQMSPTKYITSGRARLLPLHQCWISADWKETGICTILIQRKHKTGNITFGTYLVDTYCLGLKNTAAVFSKAEYEVEGYLSQIFQAHGGKIPIDYVLAHNIIYGAIAYAEDLGFKPEKDWAISQFILEEDTEDIELINVEFGMDGKPCFVSGPYDDVAKITARLNKSVGEGNYTYIHSLHNDFDFDGDYDFNDEEDDDDDFDGDVDDIQDITYEEVK